MFSGFVGNLARFSGKYLQEIGKTVESVLLSG